MVHVIGIGGVGFWLTVGLSRVIPANTIHCWDDDTLDGGAGATRLPWAPSSTKKVDLLQGHLSMVYGDTLLPIIHDQRFSGRQGLTAGDVVVDCTDMPIASRKLMWGVVRKQGCRLLRVSYDGRGSTLIVSTGLPLFVPAEGGYTNVPSLSLSFAAAGVGAEAVKRFIDNPVETFTISMSIDEIIHPTTPSTGVTFR